MVAGIDYHGLGVLLRSLPARSWESAGSCPSVKRLQSTGADLLTEVELDGPARMSAPPTDTEFRVRQGMSGADDAGRRDYDKQHPVLLPPGKGPADGTAVDFMADSRTSAETHTGRRKGGGQVQEDPLRMLRASGRRTSGRDIQSKGIWAAIRRVALICSGRSRRSASSKNCPTLSESCLHGG